MYTFTIFLFVIKIFSNKMVQSWDLWSVKAKWRTMSKLDLILVGKKGCIFLFWAKTTLYVPTFLVLLQLLWWRHFVHLYTSSLHISYYIIVHFFVQNIRFTPIFFEMDPLKMASLLSCSEPYGRVKTYLGAFIAKVQSAKNMCDM